jgi:hypothetical protein
MKNYQDLLEYLKQLPKQGENRIRVLKHLKNSQKAQMMNSVNLKQPQKIPPT